MRKNMAEIFPVLAGVVGIGALTYLSNIRLQNVDQIKSGWNQLDIDNVVVKRPWPVTLPDNLTSGDALINRAGKTMDEDKEFWEFVSAHREEVQEWMHENLKSIDHFWEEVWNANSKIHSMQDFMDENQARLLAAQSQELLNNYNPSDQPSWRHVDFTQAPKVYSFCYGSDPEVRIGPWKTRIDQNPYRIRADMGNWEPADGAVVDQDGFVSEVNQTFDDIDLNALVQPSDIRDAQDPIHLAAPRERTVLRDWF